MGFNSGFKGLSQAWSPITSMPMNEKQDQAVQVLGLTC